ncbi:hypothetical protein VMCG_10299 [Cytospora schulzeri]|uniref:Uncharacterized protein n=1 Tax=Cytospora schulzeri TaxID=448051 RepID=A0A423VCG4_9PEZI|nr:hypothetical protein VMCG_10299 [Valsa malicola]
MTLNMQEILKKAMVKAQADKDAGIQRFGPPRAATADVAFKALRRIEAPDSSSDDEIPTRRVTMPTTATKVASGAGAKKTGTKKTDTDTKNAGNGSNKTN